MKLATTFLSILMALQFFVLTAWGQEIQTRDASAAIQEELRVLQRDTINLQRTLIESGVTPSLRQDLDKLRNIDAMEAELRALRESRETLERKVEEISAKQADASEAADVDLAKVMESWVGTNMVWILVSAFLVMLMQAGFALLETGFTRAKNAAHTMSMNLLDYSIGMLAYWAFGFAIMFGGSGALEELGYESGLDSSFGITVGDTFYSFFGTGGWFLSGEALAGGIFTLFIFQLVFASTANTIPTGTLAERWKIRGFAFTSLLVAGFIYPLFGHWVWGGGWLGELGYTDFAGSTVVHMAGGVLALVGAAVVGPRVGKFNADGTPNPIPGHNIPMAFLGTFLLAFGWFGFNSGSSLSGSDSSIGLIAANTALASGAGAVIAAITTKLQFGKVDPSFCCNGLLAGLVAITAPCAFVQPWAAVVIGGIAGVLVVYSALFIEERMKLDDPVGAISVHGTCGAFGGIAVGLFADGTNDVTGLFFGDGQQFIVQCLGVLVCGITFGFLGWLMFLFTDRIVGNRASDEEQIIGLDLSEMGIESYGTPGNTPEPVSRNIVR